MYKYDNSIMCILQDNTLQSVAYIITGNFKTSYREWKLSFVRGKGLFSSSVTVGSAGLSFTISG